MSLAKILLALLRERRRSERVQRQILTKLDMVLRNQAVADSRADEQAAALEELMAAIDNLETASGLLGPKVDEVIAKVDQLKAGQGGANEAREQAVADNVNAQIDRLNTAIA